MINQSKHRSVLKVFLNDLGKYIKENNIKFVTGFGHEKEIWVYNTSNFPIHECYNLNRKLGIHNLNYFGNKNGYKN